jgi:hypothetical protein
LYRRSTIDDILLFYLGELQIGAHCPANQFPHNTNSKAKSCEGSHARRFLHPCPTPNRVLLAEDCRVSSAIADRIGRPLSPTCRQYWAPRLGHPKRLDPLAEAAVEDRKRRADPKVHRDATQVRRSQSVTILFGGGGRERHLRGQ